jgi:glycosyltransferase involved in cell wall biosynthesis
MAGDGYLVPRVKERIRSYGLDRQILLTGVLDNVQELLADTYLLLVVANNEGIPLTVMEAMAMNVPVVSTVVGATEEVLKHGVHGYLIPQNEDLVEQFTGRVSSLLHDGPLYRLLATVPKGGFFEEFSRGNMSRRYQGIFDELAVNGMKRA